MSSYLNCKLPGLQLVTCGRILPVKIPGSKHTHENSLEATRNLFCFKTV